MASPKIKRDKDYESGTVTYTSTKSGDSFTSRLADLPGVDQGMVDALPEMLRRLAVHGLNAKEGDSAASSGDVADVKATHDQLVAGEWSARGEGGGGPRVTLLAEGLAKVTGQDLETVVEKLEGMSDEEKKALRKHAQVKAACAEITAARAKERAKAAKKGAAEEAPLDF